VQNLNALELAVDEGNQRDGVGGRQFALFVCNTGDDDATLKAQSQWMDQSLHVPAVVVSGSSATISAANVVTPDGVLVMSADATSPELIGIFETTGGLVWRTAPPDTLQARVISDELTLWQASQPSLQRIGIAYVDSTYGQGLGLALASRLPMGLFTSKLAPYPRGGDPSGAVATLAAFAPNLTVLVAFPPDVVAIVEQAETHPTLTKAGGHQWFFTDASKDPAILDPSVRAELEGSYGTAPAQGAGAHFPEFRDRFMARYMVDPSDYSFTSHSYDAMYLLMLAAAYAVGGGGELTGTRMAEGLGRMSQGSPIVLSPDNFLSGVSALQGGSGINVEGASSPLDLDADAGCPTAASSPYELWQVSDGGFITSQIITPNGS
jgi:branched-chain amino acid transport system substrate-binding protein